VGDSFSPDGFRWGFDGAERRDMAGSVAERGRQGRLRAKKDSERIKADERWGYCGLHKNPNSTEKASDTTVGQPADCFLTVSIIKGI